MEGIIGGDPMLESNSIEVVSISHVPGVPLDLVFRGWLRRRLARIEWSRTPYADQYFVNVRKRSKKKQSLKEGWREAYVGTGGDRTVAARCELDIPEAALSVGTYEVSVMAVNSIGQMSSWSDILLIASQGQSGRAVKPPEVEHINAESITLSIEGEPGSSIILFSKEEHIVQKRQRREEYRGPPPCDAPHCFDTGGTYTIWNLHPNRQQRPL